MGEVVVVHVARVLSIEARFELLLELRTIGEAMSSAELAQTVQDLQAKRRPAGALAAVLAFNAARRPGCGKPDACAVAAVAW